MAFSSVVGASSVIRPGVCTSTTRPASPYEGQVIYETDTNTLAVYDGTGWVSLNPVDRDRNVVINGAIQVAQRGTSTASITATGYYTADRVYTEINALGTWTQSVENDAPTDSGFRKSLKMLCTTADSTPAAADYLHLAQRLEGQNLQHFLKGTTSAKQFTLSFWAKSNVTGIYVAELRDNDNTRSVSAQYTISVSGTWEKKTITFPADTTGAFDNDNAHSVSLNFWLASGSNFTSGALPTTWASVTNTNRAVGQTNLAAATNNYWQVTGVQLEAGAVATPFEFEDYSTTLRKCQRYFQRFGGNVTNERIAVVYFLNTTSGYAVLQPKVTMRGAPVHTRTGTIAATQPGSAAQDLTGSSDSTMGPDMAEISFSFGSQAAFPEGQVGWLGCSNTSSFISLSAEL